MQNRRTALVTGGLGDLGTAIAKAMAAAGHTVLVTYSPSNGRVQTWLQTQASAGYSFKAYPVDVSHYDSRQQLATSIRAERIHVDIVVNNAGIVQDGTFRKLTKDSWDAVLCTNLDSVFNVTKQFIDGMINRGWGRVINIASINASKGQFGQCNYAAAKAGMHGFTKSLALEVASKGVTVNTVSPGYLDTKMLHGMPADVLDTQIIPRIPIGRLGRPEEIAALVAFIASEAAGFMTGSNVSMNGGQHMY
ncbi:acetoacetyl-CoA reductase [Burkholderia multivorans]|uniref:acetoacetyl-CoA reductase n=1 Tax=Burkholderia multivorans TaxID=87883 RepID=UPI000CFEDC59|nr:acetoacetyl-CoA reductase [Burkholderia multivorans]PRG41490.1 beta-ketoacyl-ACP reductase [Burkholderia multivorans]